MKRLLVVSALSLTATLLVTSLAAAQPGPVLSKTTSKVAPARDFFAPYKFKTSGEVRFPERRCRSNQNGPNCVPPIFCPPGTTNPSYCFRPDDEDLCKGDVRIVFRNLAGSVLSSQTVRLKLDDDESCEYEAKTTIAAAGRMTVTVDFLGNTILAASSAIPKNARAG